MTVLARGLAALAVATVLGLVLGGLVRFPVADAAAVISLAAVAVIAAGAITVTVVGRRRRTPYW